MSRLLLISLLLASLAVTADSIYRTTDEKGNVVFTDAPPADGSKAEQVGIQQTNTALPPPQALSTPVYQDDQGGEEDVYSVAIIDPPNETSFPMGPGNFSVQASVKPALRKHESLQLFIDGEPRGEPQGSDFWDLTNVYRGAHDITVGVIDADGKTIAMSPPVRVFVHRPSVNFKNRN
jgi:hypothetical protein